MAQAPTLTLGIPFRPTLSLRLDPFARTGARLPYLGQDGSWLVGGPDHYLTTSIVWDTTYHEILTTYQLFNKPIGEPVTYSIEEYRNARLKHDNAKLFRDAAISSITTQHPAESEALEIQMPLKVKSKTFNRIFGGDKVGLKVNGEISIDGEIRNEANDRAITQQGQAPSTNFKIDQRQRFTITGNVGDKVTVRIDQDSERLFDFENAVKLEYTGTEDEIIQKIEAGNISLELPGTQLAAFSGQNKGLFGLKSIAKIGPLSVTTIASLEKGKKNKLKATGGEQQRPITIRDLDYVHGQFFVVDTIFRRSLTNFGSNMETTAASYHGVAHTIVESYVYESALTFVNGQIPRSGFAMGSPVRPELFDSTTFAADHTNNFYGQFRLLTPGADYDLNAQTGVLYLKQAIAPTDNTILGIAYRTSDSLVYGTPNAAPNARYFILKLLRGDREYDPTATAWNLMLRNYYTLSGQNVSPESFEGKIYLANTSPQQYTFGQTYFTNLFGVDYSGPNNSPNPDGLIDPTSTFVDFQNGFLHFPDLTPFNPSGFTKGGLLIKPDLRSIDTSLVDSALYVTSQPTVATKFTIGVNLTSRSNVLNLGVAVLEGSEEVTLNGRTLNRGTDYTIDYFSGTLTVLDPSAAVPGADLEVNYESGQIFQLDRKTLLGARAEYQLWEDSFIGATMLSLDEKPLDPRIRLGAEPVSNKIWDMNTRLVFKPAFLTKAIDALPMIATEEPSRVTVEGEVAQVFPNPNNATNPSTGDYNGVAYVDDFESSKRITPLPLNRQSWSLSAYPQPDGVRIGGGDLEPFPARTFNWYNPFVQTAIKDIWPTRDVNSNVANTTQTLELNFDPYFNRSHPYDSIAAPRNSWVAITKYLGSGYSNQQETKFLEIWMQNNDRQGTLFIDLGRISEQTIPRDTSLMSEDHPIPGSSLGNHILDPGEDVGLDERPGRDPNLSVRNDTVGCDFWDLNNDGIRDSVLVTIGGVSRWVLEPWSFDDFNNNSVNGDYSGINGTENNQRDNNYPDTEDLNGNGVADRYNDFYRFRIDLSAGDNSPYIAGGRPTGNNPDKGWRLYRIPLGDSLRVGAPDLQNIFYARIGLTNCTRKTKVAFAEIDLVGSEWEPPGAIINRNQQSYNLEADVVNTYDNVDNTVSSYMPPPGVAGQKDPITNITLKEQALRVKVKELDPGQTSYLVKTLYEPINLRDYRKLKMFVFGGAFPTKLPGTVAPRNDFDQYHVDFKLRFGVDSTRGYYEVSRPLTAGWSSIEVNLDDLPTMKYEWLQHGVAPGDTTLPTVSRILADGTVIKAVGRPSVQPSLNMITFLAVALENKGRPIRAEDQVEVWADELRVTDVKRTPGVAYRVSTDVDMAHIIQFRVGLAQTDGNFHNVNDQSGSHSSSFAGTATANIKADEFLPKSLALSFPIGINFNQTVNRPDYLNNLDISVERLTGKSEPVWNPFWRYLNNLDLLRPDKRLNNSDTLLSLQKSYSIGVSNFSRINTPDKWWEKWFANRWTMNYNHAESYATAPSAAYNISRTRSGGVSYSLPFDNFSTLKPMKWTEKIPILNKLKDTELSYVPTHVSVGVDGSEQSGSSMTSNFTGSVIQNPWSFSMNRHISAGYRLFQNVNLDYSLTLGSEAVQFAQDRKLISYAAAGYVLDPTLFSDTSRYTPEQRRQLIDSLTNNARPLDVYEKVGGYYFRTKQRDQTVSTGWSPELISWLGTDYRYTSAYSWAWQQPTATGRSVGTHTTTDQNYVLHIRQLFGRGGQAYAPVSEPTPTGVGTSLPNPNGTPGNTGTPFQNNGFNPNPGVPDTNKFHQGPNSLKRDNDTADVVYANNEVSMNAPEPMKVRPGPVRNGNAFDEEKQYAVIEGVETDPVPPPNGTKPNVAPTTPDNPPAPIPPPSQPSRRGRTKRNEDSTAVPGATGTSGPKSKLDLLWAIIDRLDDINVTASRGRDYHVYGVEDGQPDWKFQLGLASNPHLNEVTTTTLLPAQPSANLSRDYTTRSGFHLSQNFSVGLDHSWSEQEAIGLTPTSSLRKSVFLLAKGDGLPRELDVPNFSIRWSGLESAGPWRDWTQTVSLENAYQASSTRSYSATLNSPATLGGISYQTNWNPLLGINVAWKKGVTTTIRYTSTTSLTDSRLGSNSRQRSTQTGLTMTAGYTMEQGFRLPFNFWPFNGKRFKNQTEFSLSFNETGTKSESDNLTADGWSGFVETGNTSTYTLTPKITVTFSRSVTGYVQYDLGETKSSIGGTTRINAFKFNVNIQIRG